MYTTLNRIRECNPCTYGWETLLKYLGKTKPDDEPLSLLTVLNSNGFDYALWCFCAVDGFEKEKLLLGVTYAREVEHLMPAESKKALDDFERYANGLATEKEFEAACRAAADAVRAAWHDSSAAYAAARAVNDAHARADAAAHDVRVAAVARVYTAAAAARADAAAHAVRAAADAAAAASSSIKAKQEAQLRELLERTK